MSLLVLWSCPCFIKTASSIDGIGAFFLMAKGAFFLDEPIVSRMLKVPSTAGNGRNKSKQYFH